MCILMRLDSKPVDGVGDHDGLGVADAEPNFKKTIGVSRPRLLHKISRIFPSGHSLYELTRCHPLPLLQIVPQMGQDQKCYLAKDFSKEKLA